MNSFTILAQAGDEGAAESVPARELNESATESMTLQDSDPNASGPVSSRPGPFGGPYGTLIFGGLMILMFYFIVFRGPQKQKQQQKQMVSSLKKNDRVRTIGGIIGTVVDVKDDEIVLKIDESNNTKIHILPSAIGRNMSKE